MSVTTGTFPGVRIVDMPDLGAFNDSSSVVGERAGSGRFSALALSNYIGDELGVVSVLQYGGIGNGSTDNLAAINAAIADLPYGGTVTFPPGNYRSTGQIVLPAGVSIRGAGRGSSTLTMACNANPNIFMNSACDISSLQIIGSGTQTGAMIEMHGNGGTLHDFTIQNYFCAVAILGVSLADRAIGSSISDGDIFNPVAGASVLGISINHFGGTRISRVEMSGPASGTQPLASFKIGNGDTLLMSDINATLHGALLVDPDVGNNTYGLMINNCLFDSAFDTSAAFFMPGGGVWDTQIVNSWFGLSGGHGLVISPTGTGQVNGIELTGCEFSANSGGSGVRISGTGAGVWGVNVTGGRAEGNSANGAHVDGAIVRGLTLNGFRAGDYGGRGPNGANGIFTQGALDHYVITGCSLFGNGSSALNDAATGTNKVVANNLLT